MPFKIKSLQLSSKNLFVILHCFIVIFKGIQERCCELYLLNIIKKKILRVWTTSMLFGQRMRGCPTTKHHLSR